MSRLKKVKKMTGKPMKNLILLFLLILPLSVHSQITFSDLKKIDSKQDFDRLCIEQGFEKIPGSTYADVEYVFRPNEDYTDAEIFAYWYPTLTESMFAFVTDGGNGEQYDTYQNITNDIKRSCNFDSVSEDLVYYTCTGSIYRGKIGFGIREGLGVIKSKWDL